MESRRPATPPPEEKPHEKQKKDETSNACATRNKKAKLIRHRTEENKHNTVIEKNKYTSKKPSFFCLVIRLRQSNQSSPPRGISTTVNGNLLDFVIPGFGRHIPLTASIPSLRFAHPASGSLTLLAWSRLDTYIGIHTHVRPPAH